MVGQTLKDISTLTGVGRRDPNVNWSFDAMGAGEHDTNAAAAASSTQAQEIKTPAEQLEQKKTELAQLQHKEMAKATFAERDENVSPLTRIVAWSGGGPLIDMAKTRLGFGAPAAAPAANAAADATATAVKAAPPTTWVGRGQQLAAGARDMVTTRAQNAVQTARGIAAAPIASAGKGLLNVGKGALNVATSPFRTPLTSILIDAPLTALENRSYGALLADSDKWGDRTTLLGEHAGGIGTEFGKGNILAGLKNIGLTGLDASALAFGAAFSPVGAAQTAMYSLASPGRFTQEGQTMRRNDTALSNLQSPTSVAWSGNKKYQEQFDAETLPATGEYTSKGLPGFTGRKTVQDPAWTDSYLPQMSGLRRLFGGKIRENEPMFDAKTSPEVAEDTRQSLTLRTTLDSMSLDQKQKFIAGLLDNPEHKTPDADGKTHIQKTLERLSPSQQQELETLYESHQAGAMVPRPQYAGGNQNPSARMSQAEANQQQAAVAAKQEATRRKYQYQRPRQ
jgi:hypothetical protein